MKILSINWATFFRILPHWVDLDLTIRRIYLNNDDPANAIQSAPALLENREALIDAGLVEPASDGVRVKFTKETLQFRKTIQFMYNCPLLDLSEQEYFWQYIKSNFTHQEIQTFCDNFGKIFYSTHAIYEHISSVSFVEAFLAESDPQKWENRKLTYNEDGYINNKKILAGIQSIIRLIIERNKPIYIHDLGELVEKEYQPMLPDILLAGIRHLLLYASVDHQTLLPKLGLLPKLLYRINREEADEPTNVSVQDTLVMPILLDDMTILLQECAVEPIKVRKNDYCLFKKSEDILFNRFYTLPNNLQRVLDISHEWRLYHALHVATENVFVKQGRISNQNIGLLLLAKGKQWLQSSVKEQLRLLVDFEKATRNSAEHMNYNQYELMNYGIYELRKFNIYREIKGVFSNELYYSFVSYPHFLNYQSRSKNPIVSYIEKQKTQRSFSHLQYITKEKAEEIWLKILDHWVVEILFPLGCIEFGFDQDGTVAIRLTEIGRYFFGLEADFDFSRSSANQVTVLPNFEIVFMKPSPQAEIMLNPFCDRIGDTTGSLFRITSESVKQAVASGWAGERILSTLKEISKNEIPSNIEHEILEWAGQVKMVHLEHVFLIHCPNQETAALIQAEARKDVTALNPTTLSIRDRKKKDKIINAIRKKGVFLQSD